MKRWFRALINEMANDIKEEPLRGLIYFVMPSAFMITFIIITIAHFV